MHIGWLKLLTAVLALASGGAAAAFGFGAIPANVTLGQPLNLAVPVNLAEGESLSSQCASAEVLAGDTKLTPGTVRVRVTNGRDATENVLRITTSSVVEEPVLTVTVNVGCPTRMTRTLVLFADPPQVAAEPAAPPTTPAAAAVPAEPAAPTPQAAAPAAAAVASPSSPPSQRRVARAPRAARVVTAAAATRTTRTTGTQPSDAASAPRESAPAVRQFAPRTAPQARPQPRLQLDAVQLSLDQAAVLAAQEQASAARATASAAEGAAAAAEQRMRSMEAEMRQLRADAKAHADGLLQLRQQLAQRDQPSLLTSLLLGVAALLAALVAWLGWRLHLQAKLPQAPAWWDRAASEEVEADAEEAELLQSSRSASAAMPLSAAPAPRMVAAPEPSEPAGLDSMIAPPTVPAPTAVTIPPLSTRDAEMSRAMSVDEQIDLEQQADFFIALGHDDAAIDLLMAHLRSTGGGSPLPFLKLLEIHRRRGQSEAYERTRIRFNQRFNGVAPEWQADPHAGRTLEEYPQALARLQAAWPNPLDAMVELEAMLFRRGDAAELFDLPAYQEVLFLYQMARDSHQSQSAGTVPEVDVLLPVGNAASPAPVSDDGTIKLRAEFDR